LGQMNHVIDRLLGKHPDSRPTALRFILTLIFAALASTILLSLSALIWATTYLYLGALGNGQIALLYSLSALTSYGHTPIYLEEQWQLMGALESLDGMILLGLTTAYMFSVIQRVWPLGFRL